MIASDTYGAVEGGGLWKSVCHLSNQMQKQISKRDVRDSIQILNHIYLLFLINVHALLSSFFYNLKKYVQEARYVIEERS